MAEFFWNTVVNHHTYAAGGNSNYEYFGPAGKLGETLTDNTMETCNTYNMLKLTRQLFAVDPKPLISITMRTGCTIISSLRKIIMMV
jgi:DUF1680 family protein